MTYSPSRIYAHQNGDCDAATCPLCALENSICEPCGAYDDDVEVCDHGVTICADCQDEGACVLCARERAEDIADDIATERALDDWRGISA